MKCNLSNRPKWIKYGEHIDIQGITLTLGNFYVGDSSPYLILKENWNTNSILFNDKHVEIPIINPNLPIDITNKIRTIRTFHSYDKLLDDGRYAYLMLLKRTPKIASRSKYIFNHYLMGLIVRMFIDPDASNDDRLGILRGLVDISKMTAKFNDEISHFMRVAIYNYMQDEDLSFIPTSLVNINEILLQRYIHKCIDEEVEFDFTIVARLSAVAFGNLNIVDEKFIDAIRDIRFNIAKIRGDKEEKLISMASYCIDAILISKPKRHRVMVISSPEGRFGAMLRIFGELRRCYDKMYNKQQIVSNNKLVQKSDNILLKKFNNDRDFLGAELFDSSVEQTTNRTAICFIRAFDKLFESDDYLFIKPKVLFNDLLGFSRSLPDISKSGYWDKIIYKLKELGIFVYPNTRDKIISYNNDLVLCKISHDDNIDIDENIFKDILTYIKIVIFVIQEDGLVVNDGKKVADFVKSYVKNDYQLKYCMCVFWYMHKEIQYLKPYLARAIAMLSLDFRKSIAKHIKQFAFIGNDISFERVDQLERILPFLGDDWKKLKKELEILQKDIIVEDISPKTIRTNHRRWTSKTPHTNIVTTKPHKPTIVTLDIEKIRIFEEQTKESQQILSDIFNDNIEESNVVTHRDNGVMLEILKIIISKSVWERPELEKICLRYNQILVSILEQINDYAYDNVNDTVIDDDDDIVYVNTDYKDKLI